MYRNQHEQVSRRVGANYVRGEQVKLKFSGIKSYNLASGLFRNLKGGTFQVYIFKSVQILA